ncbi:hypothetical protein FSP39_017175 [Pinctada imbricata]|uniref:Uncharacterized protein n=1 Tax=Pinctada imbricata TaxID=66713 RepID=A0AA89C1R9_PINIB|nr:hypothetical protein FSP39_017175 [Pinctada imbricata]
MSTRIMKRLSLAVNNEDGERKTAGSTSDATLRATVPTPDRKKSVVGSISSGRNSTSGPSIVGLMASKRFAKRLSSKVQLNREETQGSSLQLPTNLTLKEPTYRMEPGVKFKSSTVENLIKETVDYRLDGMRYNKKITPNLCKIMTDDIKEKVKKLNYDRYKIVCLIQMGENKNQGMVASSRCQWDPKTDTYATYAYQNKHLFCTATVYGIYNE